MPLDILVGKYRRFLLWVASFTCIFTFIELWLEEHYGTTTQWIPFVLCGLGLLVIWAVLFNANRASIIALRVIMALNLAGSVFGIYEHLEHNLLFELEIRPGAEPSDVLMYAFRRSQSYIGTGYSRTGIFASCRRYVLPSGITEWRKSWVDGRAG